MSTEYTPALAHTESASPQALTITAQEKLKQLVDRIERIEGEVADLNNDKKEVYGEAKALGFDVGALRKVIAIRKIDRNEREEQEMILDLYLHAVGEV